MINLDSESTGTNTDSVIWLKSSKGSGVQIGSRIGSKSRNWNPISHSFPHNQMWLPKIGDSSSKMTGMRITAESKMLLKSGSKEE